MSRNWLVVNEKKSAVRKGSASINEDYKHKEEIIIDMSRTTGKSGINIAVPVLFEGKLTGVLEEMAALSKMVANIADELKVLVNQFQV